MFLSICFSRDCLSDGWWREIHQSASCRLAKSLFPFPESGRESQRGRFLQQVSGTEEGKVWPGPAVCGRNSFAWNLEVAENEAYVADHGTWYAVVFAHDMETLFRGLLVISGGKAFIQIVGKHRMGVIERFGFLHHADTPVEVGAETVLQVVWLGQGPFDVERLMAHQHTTPETFPAELFRGRQTALVKEDAFIVH